MIYGRAYYARTGLTQRVLAELRDAPATSSELAAETGYPLHSISAILTQKLKRGIVRRRRLNTGASSHRYLYEVVS